MLDRCFTGCFMAIENVLFRVKVGQGIVRKNWNESFIA